MPSVLLVEDEPELRELLSAALRTQGMEVRTAGTLAEARAHLAARDPELMVIDGFLPDGSGVGLIQELRDAGQDVPIMFLSALWRDEDILRRLTDELGVARVLHKPMSVQAFVAQALSCLDAPPPAAELRPIEPRGGMSLFSRELSSGLVGARAKPTPAPRAARTTPRILVVDGDPGVHQRMRGAGRELFVELILAAGPAEALRLAEQDPPDAALIDLSLALRDAADLPVRLRAQPGQEALPLGFVSASGRLDARLQAADAGAQVFVLKPLSLERLDGAIRRLLALRPREAPRVLILDDDPGFAEDLSALLERSGFTTVTLSQPRRALSSLAEVQPDLLLLDGMMPEVGGVDLCRVIRASVGWENLPILLLTGLSGSGVLQEGLAAGADEVMEKGAPLEHLLSRMRAMIERSRARASASELEPRTGLLDRRAFLRSLSLRAADARRQDRALSVGLLRLVGLDSLSEQRGALVADEVLSAAARLLSVELRGLDLKARWSPRDLAIALPGAEAPQAERVLDRLARRVNDMVLARDEVVPVDVRYALGTSPDDGLRVDALLSLTERRLGEA